MNSILYSSHTTHTHTHTHKHKKRMHTHAHTQMHTGIQKGNTKCCVICHAVFFSFFNLIKRVWLFVKISIRLAILPWPKPQCWKFLGCCKCDNFWSTVALPVSDHTFILALILALFKPVFKILLDNTHHSVLTSYQFCWLWPILKVTAAFWSCIYYVSGWIQTLCDSCT